MSYAILSRIYGISLGSDGVSDPNVMIIYPYLTNMLYPNLNTAYWENDDHLRYHWYDNPITNQGWIIGDNEEGELFIGISMDETHPVWNTTRYRNPITGRWMRGWVEAVRDSTIPSGIVDEWKSKIPIDLQHFLSKNGFHPEILWYVSMS